MLESALIQIMQLTCNDVPHVIKCACMDSVVLKIKSELDQVVNGLEAAGVLRAIRRYPDLFKPLFLAGENILTAGEELEYPLVDQETRIVYKSAVK